MVRWRPRKKSISSSSAPARRARSMPRRWPRPARRSCCSTTGRTGSTSDLISSDIWGRRIKPAGAPFILEGKHPVSMGAQGGWGVGGAALHYFANFPRYLPNDFRIKSEHNRAHDWPISYDDVAPYYDKVAQEIGVSGDAGAEELWRPKGKPYPMPPMKTFKNGQVWLKGFEAAGIRMVPAAVGMNSTEFKGRAACIYDGWCHVGCPIGALANPLVTFLAEARAAGAEVRAWSTVTRVVTDHVRQQGDRRRVLRSESREAVPAGERGGARRLGRAEPASPPQLRGRQARERSIQLRRPRRQIRDDPLRLGHQRDVRRGRGDADGHHRRAVHVLRALRQDRACGRVRLDLHRRRLRQQGERARRPRQYAARSVRAGARTTT